MLFLGVHGLSLCNTNSSTSGLPQGQLEQQTGYMRFRDKDMSPSPALTLPTFQILGKFP